MIRETLKGIVEGVRYHNEDTGWSVLRLKPFGDDLQQVQVTVHQMRVFAGATMKFTGAWVEHPRYGRQFRADSAVELKPATSSALEKYLGSGLIKGVGPKTARKIVRHFGKSTLDVFEKDIDRLLEVPGIAQKKLAAIKEAWYEHRAVRDVMIFLQSHGISTLFAVRIFKEYGHRAIERVSDNPYRLADDIYGIGFFSADRIALSIGHRPDGRARITAAIRHVLAASRDQGHCYLTYEQILTGTTELLKLDLAERLPQFLRDMTVSGKLRVRELPGNDSKPTLCYYSNTLYYEEAFVAEKLLLLCGPAPVDEKEIRRCLARCLRKSSGLKLSDEQEAAVRAIAALRLAILTGGPGCGKTTTLKVLVDLLTAMGRRVLPAAPTGRAAQRMGEVIGLEAGTIHRLLQFQGGRFARNESSPLRADFLIIDESSMLDIGLTASLLKAVAPTCSVLFIGDSDQLPSVGAGCVLHDMIASGRIPCFRLTRIFRQARKSRIISFAHSVNQGRVPKIASPFREPKIWLRSDCFFIDVEEATREQVRFIDRVRRRHGYTARELERQNRHRDPYLDDDQADHPAPLLPEKFSHVDLGTLVSAENTAQSYRAVLKRVHPWSALHYGLTALDVIRKLYTEWIPKYYGDKCEIQILSPMVRGSLGTANLNRVIQQAVNPPAAGKGEITIGEKILRVGDRVIHRRNNYDLGVFNGDIGRVVRVNNSELTCTVEFFPDGRRVEYRREQMTELDRAFAITVHKSQGSEFEIVILPIFTQHYRMLRRNLLYTGLTRARRLAVLVGMRRALVMAVSTEDSSKRQTALDILLRETVPGRGGDGKGTRDR